MTVYAVASVTDAILTALTGAGLTVGDGVKPDDAGWAGDKFVGYVVVHQLAGGIVTGTLGDPYADGTPRFQLTAHGAARVQCQVIADKARAAVLSLAGSSAGPVRISHIEPEMLGGARRDDLVQPPLWLSAERFSFFVTP